MARLHSGGNRFHKGIVGILFLAQLKIIGGMTSPEQDDLEVCKTTTNVLSQNYQSLSLSG